MSSASPNQGLAFAQPLGTDAYHRLGADLLEILDGRTADGPKAAGDQNPVASLDAKRLDGLAPGQPGLDQRRARFEAQAS